MQFDDEPSFNVNEKFSDLNMFAERKSVNVNLNFRKQSSMG